MESLASFLVCLATVTSITLMLSASLDLQVGNCGLVNFGQVAFLAIGAYATAITIALGSDPVAAVLYGAVAGSLFGILMSLTVRNMSGTYWGILSLSLAEIVRIVALNERWLTGGANGISVLRRISHLPVTIFICTAIVIALVSIIEGSPFGRIIRMIREGDRLPEALSKNV